MAQEPQEATTALSARSAAATTVQEWESFAFLLETEALFPSRDAVVSLLATGMKKRISVISPDTLLAMLSDPAFSSLATELHSQYPSLASVSFTSTTTSTTMDPSGSQLQPSHSPDLGAAQQEVSSTARRLAMAKLIDGDVWTRLLLAKMAADKAMALRAKTAVQQQVPGDEAGATDTPKGIAVAPVLAVRKKKPAIVMSTTATTPASTASKKSSDTASTFGDDSLAPGVPVAGVSSSSSPTTSVAAGTVEDGRRTPGGSKRSVKKKGKPKGSGSDYIDDAPQGSPDVIYLLDGFPATAEQAAMLVNSGVTIDVVVSLSMSSSFHRAAGEAQGGGLPSRQRGVSRQPPQVTSQQVSKPGRKRKTETDKMSEDMQAAGRTAEAPATFSQLHNELKTAACCENTIFLEMNDGDPTDPYETVHRLAAKLYDLFVLRTQYLAWLKTCNITTTPAASPVEATQLASKYQTAAAAIPGSFFTPAALTSCLAAAGHDAVPTATSAAVAGDDVLDAETEARLTKYIDDTLQWLLSDDEPTKHRGSERHSLGDLGEMPSLVVLRHGDIDGINHHGKSHQQLAFTGASAIGAIPGVGRHLMPPSPEKNHLEQANDLAELTKMLEGVASPPLTMSEVDRTLTLLEFEDMLAGETVPKFDDRVYLESFDADVFPQVFADALESRPVVRSHYFADRDKMLVCLDSGGTTKSMTWSSQVVAKTTFKQWLEATRPNKRPDTVASVSAPATSTTTVVDVLHPPAGIVVYDIDQTKVRIETTTHTLFLEDGCTLTACKTRTPTKVLGSIRLALPEPFPATVVMHKLLSSSLTATFSDLTSIWIGEQRDGKCALSFAQPDGRVVLGSLGMWIDQINPATTPSTDESADINTDPLTVFEHDVDSADRETSRRVFIRDGTTGVCRFFASGSTLVMMSTGETESFSPKTGVTQRITADGKFVKKTRDSQQETVREFGAATVIDPDSGHVIVTREDMTMIVRSPTGEMQARFPDGTTIRSTASEGTAFVETPGFAVVRRIDDMLTVDLDGNGTMMSISKSSGISFKKSDTLAVAVKAGGNVVVQAVAHVDKPDVVRPGEYHFDLRTSSLLTPEYDRRRFAIDADLIPRNLGEPTAAPSVGDDVAMARSHPPRLFRVAEDGTAVEYLNQRQLEPFIASLKARKTGTTVAELPVPGEEVVSSIACVRQLQPQQCTSSTPSSDASMPRIIAFDDPDYVHRSTHSQPQPQIVAVVRQLLRHRRLTDEQLDAFLDTLDRFEDQRKHRVPVSTSMTSGNWADPRSPEEREAQARLQDQLCAMLREEAEAARVAKEYSEVDTKSLKPKSTTSAEVTTTTAASSVAPQATIEPHKHRPCEQPERLNYFESEEGSAFQQQQQQQRTTPIQQQRTTSTTRQSAEAVEKPQKQAKPGSPPAVGLGMDTDGSLHDFTIVPPMKSTTMTQQQQQPAMRRAINTSSLAGAHALPPPAQAFAVFPQSLAFGIVELGFSHQLEVSLTNMTFDSARFVVKKLSEVSLLRLAYPRGPVAPGMTAKVTVEFVAQKTGRYADEICIVVGIDETVVRIVVTAEVISREDFAKLPRTQSQRRWRSKKVPLPSQPQQQTAPSPVSTTMPTQFPPLRK